MANVTAVEGLTALGDPTRRTIFERVELLMVGTFEDAQRDGSMAIFRSREAAEEFAAADPFVLEGVVRRYEVRGWNEVLTR